MDVKKLTHSELYYLTMLCEYQINVKFAKCSVEGRQTSEYNDLVIKRMELQNEIERRLLEDFHDAKTNEAKK